MKNVFEISEKNETGSINGEKLIDREISPELSARWDAYFEKAEPAAKISPKYTVYSAIILLIGFLAVWMSGQESAVMKGVSGFLAVFALIALVAVVLATRRARRAARAESDKAGFEDRRVLWQATLEDFNAPAGAPVIDVMEYCVPNKKKRICSLMEEAVFMDGGRLCFADGEHRLSLDAASVRRFYRVSGNVEADWWNWNKEIPAGTGIYADVKANNSTAIIPGYAVLEFTEGGEDYGIWIPCYDVPVLESVLGMTAEPAAEDQP